MFCQNGSAILVAILAERSFGGWGITFVSVVFTVLYFVVVEAMAKTFGVLHSDRAALAVAPFVWFLGRALALPTRALIGLANVLLRAGAWKQGLPSVGGRPPRDGRGRGRGQHRARGDRAIHSIFEFGDTIVREVMVPGRTSSRSRPTRRSATSRHWSSSTGTAIPVYREDLDDVAG